MKSLTVKQTKTAGAAAVLAGLVFAAVSVQAGSLEPESAGADFGKQASELSRTVMAAPAEPVTGAGTEWETRFIPALPTWIRDVDKGNEFNMKMLAAYASRGYEADVAGCRFSNFSEGSVELRVKKLPQGVSSLRSFEFWSGDPAAIESRIGQLSRYSRVEVKCRRDHFLGDANVLIQYEPRTRSASPFPKTDDQAPSRAAKDIVAGEFGLPLLRVSIAADAVQYQSALPGTAVAFDAALRSAMKSFLEDYTDEESPLSLVIDEVFIETGENAPLLPYSPQVVEKARARLNEYLNRGGTELRLLSGYERAEHGESVRENWIFFLWIPDLSDHGHWAVVNRSGGGQVYNYGFN